MTAIRSGARQAMQSATSVALCEAMREMRFAARPAKSLRRRIVRVGVGIGIPPAFTESRPPRRGGFSSPSGVM